MRVTEAVDDGIRVVITGAAVPAGQPRVRTELDHAERNNRARERVAVSAGADEWIDVAREIALGGYLRGDTSSSQTYKDQNAFARDFALWRRRNRIDQSFQRLKISQVQNFNRRVAVAPRPRQTNMQDAITNEI